MKKILVTGGLGQIGSHIAEMLLERGDKVGRGVDARLRNVKRHHVVLRIFL